MDELQIVYSFIGSFFGFGFAIIAEMVFSFLKKRSDMRLLFANLTDELKEIKADIAKNVDKPIRNFFITPIWESVIQSGDMLKLFKVNKELYDKVLLVYNKIAVLRIVELDFNQRKALVLKTRNIIIKKVEEIINVTNQ
ncbi:MAG: hypothetical protein LBT55_02475 [Clostridiaceae bacterium]|jgi:hypothetical protein|nr:hypothetical protein [Clostridiaceae bacterium]